MQDCILNALIGDLEAVQADGILPYAYSAAATDKALNKGQVTMYMLKALLARESAEWTEESGFLRFRVKHGGMLWETACRPSREALLFYARFPFRCRDPETARKRCEEMNRRLVRGALFLGEDGYSLAEKRNGSEWEQRLRQLLRER